MATLLKLRRGTTAQHSAFTGAEGEVTVDTTKDTLVVHDGTTAGGVPLATEAALATKQNLDAELTTLSGMSSSRATFLAGTEGFGFRNRIINGDMRIDQRNAGASVTPAASNYTLDRWALSISQASKLTVQQNRGTITPPNGFSNYLGIFTASAVSIGAGDYFQLSQSIEGFNVADLNWGTANAKTVTLSFQVYSSLTGTFGGSLRNSASNRSYPFTYSIPVANTWTTVSVTVAGDTSGTWVTNNGVGLTVSFGLGVGSTYSGTAGAWAGAFYISATGATSVVGTNGATFYITGVQLEAGTVASPFERRDYGRELMMCQRYFEKSFAIGTAPAEGLGSTELVFAPGFTAYTTSDSRTPIIYFSVKKRAKPTITFYRPASAQGGTTNGVWSYFNGAWDTMSSSSPVDGQTQDYGFAIEAGKSGALTFGRTYLAGGGWAATAEL